VIINLDFNQLLRSWTSWL